METELPKILYQETNPYGSMTAYLEDDGRTIYLYLQAEQNPEFDMMAVWVQNRIPAPKFREVDELQRGIAPILCADEIDQPSLDPPPLEDIRFIWTEEGDGVALFYRDELISFLPPWSGINGLHGYSKYCIKESLTAYPLGNSQHGVIAQRVQSSKDYWEFRAEKDSWKKIQQRRLLYLEERLGKHIKYWSADGGKFPPLAIAKFYPNDYPGVVVYSTIGMSAQNMPTVELYHKNYLNHSRIELAIGIQISEEDNTELWVPHALGEIIKFPWNMRKWLGEGHSITMPRRDPNSLLDFRYFFLSNQFPSKEELEQPLQDTLFSESGQPVKFLFLLPITEEELYYVRSKGAKSFLKLISNEKKSWVHNSQRESFI